MYVYIGTIKMCVYKIFFISSQNLYKGLTKSSYKVYINVYMFEEDVGI